MIRGLAFLLLAAIAALWPDRSAAQSYPVRVVTLVSHSNPGSGSDVFLRGLAKHVAPILGVNIVVENVRGGGGAAALVHVANAPPDGSVMFGAVPAMINASLLARPSKTYKDLALVANVFLDPTFAYTRSESPFATLADALAAAKPGGQRQLWGVGTPGSAERQIAEISKRSTESNAAVVTHEGGGELLVSVLNGTVALGLGELSEVKAQIDAGRIKLIGVFARQRISTAPHVQTSIEAGLQTVSEKFRGIAGPKGLPPHVVRLWESAVEQVLAKPEFKAWYTALGLEPAPLKSAEFASFIDRYVEREQAFLRDFKLIKN